MRQQGNTSPLFFGPLQRLPRAWYSDRVDKLSLLFKSLRRVLASRGRSGDDIDDLMQEAFLRLQVYCRERTVENTEAFLVRTVLNLSAQQGRDARPYQSMTDDPDILAIIDPTPSPR
jgi:DNA-directed RNA polymerase specialized sigma24 family protein